MKKNKTILIKDAEYIITMDKKQTILRNASLFIEGSEIREIPSQHTSADTIIDAKGMIVIPGLINCHHHMFQCGLRGLPELQNQTIDRWIAIVCDYTKKINETTMYYAALANMAELLLYGCTTTTDMHYLFPKGTQGLFESSIRAAKDIGIRFHPFRGSMSLSKKDGQSFPDDVVETSEEIMMRSEYMIKTYHDASRLSMLRIGLAPCTLFSSSSEDYVYAAQLAKTYDVNLQTHVSESAFEDSYAMDTYGKRPLEYLQSLGWTGAHVSFVHGVNFNDDDIQALKKSKSTLVHCPISNARKPVGSAGIAPVTEMLSKGIPVGIGVDGSAGNDSSNVLEELRWARTLQGVREKTTYLKPMPTLAIGTIEGAKTLRWDDALGSLEEGKAADIAMFTLHNDIEHVGANDPITALLACQARRAETVIVNGTVVVEKSMLISFDEKYIIDQWKKNIV